jgi:hypothetical protein
MVVCYDSFGQDSTGLPMVVWIGHPWGRHHFKPRMKVATDYFHYYWKRHRTVSFYIHPEKARVAGNRFSEYEGVKHRLTNEDKQYVLNFISKNWESLVLYWYGFLDTVDLIERIKQVILRPDHPYLMDIQKYRLSKEEKGSEETIHRIFKGTMKGSHCVIENNL